MIICRCASSTCPPTISTKCFIESTNTPAASELSATRLLRLADHDYQVDIQPSEAFLQANHSSVTSLVVLGGLLSLLLSALALRAGQSASTGAENGRAADPGTARP